MSDPTAGNSSAPPTGAGPEPTTPAAQSGVPQELWIMGLGFSLVLILAGLVAMAADYARLFSIGALAVCIGFGVALTIFGTRAGGTFLNFNVIGGGAMAVVLYLLLYMNPISPPDSKYLEGIIYDTRSFKNVRGSAKDVFLTGRSEGGDGNFRFVVFEREIGRGSVRFNFDFAEGGTQKEFFINCISAQDLKTAISRQEKFSLSLEKVETAGDDPTEAKFRLIETSSGREIGRMNQRNCETSDVAPSLSGAVGYLDWFATAAHAQQGPAVDIPTAIALLESDDGNQRDHAREQLALLRGATAYTAVTASWNIKESSYRADLGRLVAWSAAIDQNRATAVTLAEALSPAQVRYIVQLTGQGDITMRQFATEVLHRLLETTGWPSGPSAARAQEIVDATLAVFASPGPDLLPKAGVQLKPDTLLYNAVVAIGFTKCNIGALYRQRVVDALSSLAARLSSSADSAKTADKVRQVLVVLKACS